jgi:hypothetical protein
MKRFYFLVALGLCIFSNTSFSQISLTGGTYSQDFNTLAISGTSSTLPSGWIFSETGTNANAIYTAGTGSSNAGDTYSFGAGGSNERAFGGLLSGSLVPTIGASFINNTGGTITSFTISYTGEQWRLGTSGRNDRLDFQFSLNASSLSTGTWTDVDALDFVAPIGTGSVGALNGNASANQSAISYTISGLSIANGATFFIRWNDFNASGADDGLAVDDFSLSFNGSDADVTPPAISSLSPANGATSIPASTNASIEFSEPVQKGTGAIVVKKTSDNSFVQTIDVTSSAVAISGSTVTIALTGLAMNTAYYIEMPGGAFKDVAGNEFAGISGNTTWSFATGNILYAANFQDCSPAISEGFTQFGVTGASVWACTTFGRDPNAPAGTLPFPSGVQINGFANGSNASNIDWLISPSFDLTGTTYPLLSFWSRTAFNGSPLQLKVSTDYIGGDPRLATWTDVNGKFPGETSNTWTLSENINLSAFKASNVHFAFVYTSTDEDGSRWTLDDVSLTNSPTPPPPSLTTFATDIQFTYVASGSNAVKTFNFIGNDLEEAVTVNATSAFEVSKDGISFSPSITYSVDEANNVTTTVYVRFAPTQKNQDYAGTITVSTSNLSDVTNLKGTSIDPATTLEVVNWNIEWFGSTVNGPTNDQQQQQNVKTVLQNLGADIYGLVEVVDEARLANVVSQMPGYTYVIGNYGSHVNPPDVDGGPLSEAQKLAFVYKTSVFSNVSVRPLINNQDTQSVSYDNWSSGRYPLLMTADVTLNCVTKKINFILIHAKANTSPTKTSYARRLASANELHDTIQTYFANENVIVLGDFNDDLDKTITDGITPSTTSYVAFTSDNINFFSPTLSLSLAGKKSTVSHNDVIDHVMLSNEMEPYYMPSTATILSDVTSLVSNYGSSTTDHYPVFTRYKFEAPAPPVVTTCPTVPAFCANSNSSYTIPAFVANSPCGSVNYSYAITGATSRSGNTNDASGSFEIGTSTITWTASDAAGNSVSCETAVVVNVNPTVTIPDAYALNAGVLANTVYIGYVPASSITLTSIVEGGSPDYTYNWSNGSLASNAIVNPTSNTTYSLTVTDANGCVGTASKNISVLDIRAGKKLDKASVCHAAGNRHSIEIAIPAIADHLAHGDMLGSCETVSPSITSRYQKQTSVLPELQVKALPNPSASYFELELTGGNVSEQISIKVTDILGRTVELKNDLSSNRNLTIGADYRAGIYFVEVIQGTSRKQVKLVKLSN